MLLLEEMCQRWPLLSAIVCSCCALRTDFVRPMLLSQQNAPDQARLPLANCFCNALQPVFHTTWLIFAKKWNTMLATSHGPYCAFLCWTSCPSNPEMPSSNCTLFCDHLCKFSIQAAAVKLAPVCKWHRLNYTCGHAGEFYAEWQ